MKHSEFTSLLVANVHKTTHLRAYLGEWPTSIGIIPDSIATKIGFIVTLLQEKIDQGVLLKPNQCLLIYNFEALSYEEKKINFYSLDMLIKPLTELNETAQKTGDPYQVVINGNTGEVMNNSQYLTDTGYLTGEDIAANKLEPPIIYGRYPYPSLDCCFATIISYLPIDPIKDLFDGKYDQSKAIQQSQVFDNWTHTHVYLNTQPAFANCYIAELPCHIGEFEKCRQAGLGQFILKVFDMKTHLITESPYLDIHKKTDWIDDIANQATRIKP